MTLPSRPIPSAKLSNMVDASNVALGAVLQQSVGPKRFSINRFLQIKIH